MLKLQNRIKPLALLLVLVYFVSAGFAVFGTGEHLFDHQQSADHASQHASFVCTWMCAASSHVHMGNESMTNGLPLIFEVAATSSVQVFENKY